MGINPVLRDHYRRATTGDGGPPMARDGGGGGGVDTLPLPLREFIAGGIAGATAKSAIAPFERVKILFQTRRAEYQSVGLWGSFRKIRQTEGLPGFYRGNGANTARIIPYAALHFMAYEQFRLWIMDHFPAIGRGPFLDLVSGSIAGGTSTMVTYPLDLVRTKLAFQVVGSSGGLSQSEQAYGGITDCISKIYRQNGIRGLYRGIGPTLIGIFPYSGLRFYFYEKMKTLFPEHKQNIYVSLAYGSVAGLVSQTMTYPLDVVRRQMQANAFSTTDHTIGKGTLESLITIVKTQGWRNLYSGLSINYVKVVPQVAIGFTVYEEAKKWMKVPPRDKSKAKAITEDTEETSNNPSSLHPR